MAIEPIEFVCRMALVQNSIMHNGLFQLVDWLVVAFLLRFLFVFPAIIIC